MFGMKITGIGCYVPERVVTNSEIAEILKSRLVDYQNHGKIGTFTFSKGQEQFESDAQWIEERTGIKERRFADNGNATSDLAVRAAQAALNNAGLNKKAVQFIIVATTTPDHHATPPTAALVQHKLEIPANEALIFQPVSLP